MIFLIHFFKNKSYSFQFAIFGFIFGLFFPVGSYLYLAILNHENIYSIISKHSNPLLYIIDTAPLILSIFAFYIGKNRDRLNENMLNRVLESEKMSLLGELTAGMGHEINNPLAIMQLKLQLIKKYLKAEENINKEKLNSDLGIIEKNIIRVQKIVNGIKLISRKSDNDPFESFPTDEIITDTIEICLDKIKRNQVEIQNLVSDSKIHLNCRPAEITQILINLINNSIDAISDLEIKWIRIEIKIKDSQTAQIIVTDSGNGIPTNIANKMMNKFYSTKQLGKGTGLGLSISKDLAIKNNGNIFYNPASPNTQFILEVQISDDSRKLVA